MKAARVVGHGRSTTISSRCLLSLCVCVCFCLFVQTGFTCNMTIQLTITNFRFQTSSASTLISFTNTSLPSIDSVASSSTTTTSTPTAAHIVSPATGVSFLAQASLPGQCNAAPDVNITATTSNITTTIDLLTYAWTQVSGPPVAVFSQGPVTSQLLTLAPYSLLPRTNYSFSLAVSTTTLGSARNTKFIQVCRLILFGLTACVCAVHLSWRFLAITLMSFICLGDLLPIYPNDPYN